jgi:hypothetical protein
MTYRRFTNRNGLASGDYDASDPKGLLRGDLRRLERDTMEVYADRWAKDLDMDAADVRRVLDRFLGEP